jgi:hypothetical protein
MEAAKRTVLSDGTEFEVDPARPYSRFMKISKGPVTVRFSHADASAMYETLWDYFQQPEVAAAGESRGVILGRLAKLQEKVAERNLPLGTELETIIHELRSAA